MTNIILVNYCGGLSFKGSAAAPGHQYPIKPQQREHTGIKPSVARLCRNRRYAGEFQSSAMVVSLMLPTT